MLKPIPYYFLLSTLLLMLAQGCKKEEDEPCCDASNPECANYDPCFGRKDAVSADFKTEVRIYRSLTNPSTLESDTFFAPYRIYFVASESNSDSYEWKIGSEPRVFIDKEFFLSFDCPNILYQDIFIRLITERLSDSNCTSQNKLRDTLTKMIYFVKEIESPVFGEYRGYLKHDPSKLFNVKFIYKSAVSNPNPDPCSGNLWSRNIYNLANEGCYKELKGNDGSVLNQFNFPSSIILDTNTCQYPNGYYRTDFKDIKIKYNPTNKEVNIKFTYQALPSSSNSLPKVIRDMEFVGTKL